MNAIIERLNSAGGLFVNFSASMLVQASILILILLALDFLLRKKVRAVFRYCVWLLVLVKLVIPPSISSPLSIGSLFGDKLSEIKIAQTESSGRIEQAGEYHGLPARENTAKMAVLQVPELTITEPKPELYKEIDPAGTHLRSLEWQKEQAKIIEASTEKVEKQLKPAAASVSINWQGTAFLAWIIVVLILILLLIQRAMFVRGLVAQADEITGGLNDLVKSCGKLVGMRGKVRLKTSPNAASPAVCGLFKPVILLPKNLAPSLTKEQLKAVLVHELIHIKRGDLWINLFQALLQIAYFYNPLVWLANTIIRRAREQAVDEAVQVALGESAESYPQILVNVAKLAFKRPALSLRFIGVVENKSALKNRIVRMLSRPIPKKAKLGLIGLVSIFLVAAVLLPMATARNEESIIELEKPKFEATLPNGVTVELVGTCQYTESGINCYRPDGLPLGKSLKIAKWNQKPKAGDTGIMLKVTGPEDFSFSYDKILGAKGWEGSCQVINESGEELEGYEAALTRFDDKQMTTELKFGVAAGAWKTVAEHDGRSMAINNGISFTKATETEQGVQIFTTDTLGRDVTQRIVAIDNNGRLHPWKGHTGSVSDSQIRQSVGTFPNLKLEQIEKFQFQTRPYEWVEFKNVSLKPNFKTDIKIEGGKPAVQTQAADAGKNSESEQDNLQQLIDSARAGQMVTIPKGVYTEPIVINKSLRLKGEDANDCIIEVTADEPAIFVDTKGKGLVTIENLTIKWQLATSDKDIEYPIALVAKDSRAQIKNCNFVPLGNFQRSPFAVRAMGFTNLNIDNCRFEGFEYTIQFGDGTEGILQNSVITNCGHQGVINYSGSTLRVKGNIITGSKFHAVRCTGGKIYVEDNLLIKNANRGIYLGNKSASGAITNNIIIGNGTNISGFANSQVSITNNIIADAGYAGISMRDSCRLLIADNIFLKNGRGIILHEEAGKNSNRISRNTFWKNKVNFENIKQFAPPIEAEPGLVDPNNGDFSLKSGSVREQNQGLKKPEIFKGLWKKFKKLESTK